MDKNNIFIKRSMDIHNNKYDYSLVEYKNNRIKIKIICPIHGLFEQTPYKHLIGRGCHYCAGNLQLNTIDFIKKSNEIHNYLYDYSLSKYINTKTKVKIICKEHGVFEQSPNNHITKKQGCPKCKGGIKLTINEFINRSREIHNNKYDYSLVNYININTKVKIICPKHGVFEQTPNCHLNQGYGCQKCSESKGEKQIRKFLEKNEIKYNYEKTFENCKFKYKLKFDFYLPDYNTCIEYNGIQHYKPVNYFGGEKVLKYQKNNDKIKDIYCKSNNIELLTIKYDEDIIPKLKNIIKV